MAVILQDGDICELKTACALQDQVAINITHWKVDSVVGNPTNQDAVDALDAAIAPQYPGVMTSAASYYGSQLYLRRGPVTYEPVIQTGNSGVGGGTGGPLPLQTAGIFTKKTGLAGRSHRGRFYTAFPFVDGSSASGHPTNAFQAALAVLANVICSTQACGGVGNNASLIPVIGAGGSSPYYTVNAFQVRGKWARQGRRGDYGRPNAYPPW